MTFHKNGKRLAVYIHPSVPQEHLRKVKSYIELLGGETKNIPDHDTVILIDDSCIQFKGGISNLVKVEWVNACWEILGLEVVEDYVVQGSSLNVPFFHPLNGTSRRTLSESIHGDEREPGSRNASMASHVSVPSKSKSKPTKRSKQNNRKVIKKRPEPPYEPVRTGTNVSHEFVKWMRSYGKWVRKNEPWKSKKEIIKDIAQQSDRRYGSILRMMKRRRVEFAELL